MATGYEERTGSVRHHLRTRIVRLAIALCVGGTTCASLQAQDGNVQRTTAGAQNSTQDLQGRVQTLEQEVSELKALVKQLQAAQNPQDGAASRISAPSNGALTRATVAPSDATPNTAPSTAVAQSPVASVETKAADVLHGTTINLGLDMYYEYNFNNPVGRVNLLRAYDVLSNEFSLNQASVVIEHAPNLAEGSRWGGRLDLQFGQATDTLQGNPSSEPRPDIYRNIFQAYGTYVVPLGKGWQVDFGKWGSSLGIEGNYTKDQINYSRSYWFNFLPFYHMGARIAIPVNDRFTVNYWIVNGTNQVEATNGFKDELFGFTAKPLKTLTWTMNYYLGQEHPDRAVSPNCGPVPVQPGLCFTAISPAPDGKTDIFDSYATWQPNSKLTLAIEGDYFVTRLWASAAPGKSSAPSHVDGGAGYLQYQLTPKIAVGTRAEYLSDRGGVFSGITQALKENTVTFDYKLAHNFLMRYEWRRDFSNRPSFLTDRQGILGKDQNTATLGLVWWWGGKQGSW